MIPERPTHVCTIGNVRHTPKAGWWRFVMNRNFTCAAVMFVALLTSNVYGQAVGKIVGTLTHPSSAVIPGAQVTIINEGTQFARSTVTNAEGQYFVNSFP